MKYFLDGNDWEADYFISSADFDLWQIHGWRMTNIYLDSAMAAGFADPEKQLAAAYKATVPGCDRSVLLENNVIPDPYHGRNLEHSRWSENVSWSFRKKFRIPENMQNKKRFQLRFCGIDYSAAFFINGVYLGKHVGMFLPFEADVSDYIRRDGENMVAVIFDPMPQASPDHTFPFDQKPAEFANYHRSQMSWGWDWMRGMVAAGIWDHVYLTANDDIRITDCFFRANASGEVELTVDSIAQAAGEYKLKIAVEPIDFEAQSTHLEYTLQLDENENSSVLHFTHPQPELWYPNGSGKQPLYRLTLQLDNDVVEKQVAFRTLSMQRNQNSPDRSYNQTFTFNGKKIFARGVNWIPMDLMLGKCGKDEYERQVRLAAEAHVNIFRVWGGGIIEKEEFYDACDRYGIVVWQEFMHACSSYRKDAEYLAIKAREAEAVLRKIRNHVCVSLICGGNEMQYYGEIPDSPLYLQYQAFAKKFTPDLPFHTSSPDLSRPGERNHGPWHCIEHEVINNHDRLLASEVGCCGFPEFESVRKFIPERELDTPETQSWKYHFALTCRNQDWRKPLEKFDAGNSRQICQATQFVQSDILGYWMNHCRRKFPHTSGCFFWQYNEPWPTFFASIIDYYTLPKAAYYRLQRVQKNVILSLRDQSWCCKNGKFAAELFITADNNAENLECSFRLSTGDGKELLKRNYICNIAENSSEKLDELNLTLPPAAEVPYGLLLAELQIARGGQVIFHDIVPYGYTDFKQLFQAPAPAITADAFYEKDPAGGETILRVTVSNKAFAAIQLRLNLPELSCRNVYWQDNCIILPCGGTESVAARLVNGTELPDYVELSACNMPEIRCKISEK